MIIHKEITQDNEFYLYMNGELIYKKWLDTGASKVFDVMAYDKYTHTSYTDLDMKNSDYVISVLTQIRFLTPKEGGRRTAIGDGYRPNHVFEYDSEGQVYRTYMGQINLEGLDRLELGINHTCKVRFLLLPGLESYLVKGRKWWIHEANRLVGHAEMIDFVKE